MQLPGPAKVSTPSKTHPGAREFLLLFPYYERGTVWDAIVKASEDGPPWPYPEPTALRVFMDACCGVNAMHSHGFAHRDMKVRGDKLELSRHDSSRQLVIDRTNSRFPKVSDLLGFHTCRADC